LSAATNSDPKKDREQHCVAFFYLAEYALIKGKPDEAKRLFQKAIDTGVTYFAQYTGSQAELKRLPAR
jgi:lipoprotein NlpI